MDDDYVKSDEEPVFEADDDLIAILKQQEEAKSNRLHPHTSSNTQKSETTPNEDIQNNQPNATDQNYTTTNPPVPQKATKTNAFKFSTKSNKKRSNEDDKESSEDGTKKARRDLPTHKDEVSTKEKSESKKPGVLSFDFNDE